MKFSIVLLTGLMALVPIAPVNAESPIVVGDSNRDVLISSFGRKYKNRSRRRHRRIYYPRRGRGRGRIYSPRRGGVRIYSPRRGGVRIYSPRRGREIGRAHV